MGSIQQYNELSNQTLNEMIAVHKNGEDKHWSTDIEAALELAKENHLVLFPNLIFHTWESFYMGSIGYNPAAVYSNKEHQDWVAEAVKPSRAIALAYLLKWGLLERENRTLKGTRDLPTVDMIYD